MRSRIAKKDYWSNSLWIAYKRLVTFFKAFVYYVLKIMKQLKKFAGHAVSLAFIIYLFSNLELDRLGPVARTIHWEYFFSAIIVTCMSYLAHSFRWKTFFKETEVDISSVFRSVTIGHMFNTILPSKSGELIRPLFLQRASGIPYANILSTCLIERVLDGIVVLACLAIGAMAVGIKVFPNEAALAMGILYAAAAGGLALVYFKRSTVQKLIRIAAPKAMSAKLQSAADNLADGAQRIKGPKTFRKIVFHTLFYWTLNIWAVWLLLQGIELSPELRTVEAAMLIIGTLGLALTLPSAPASVGVYHYAVYYVLVFITENTEGALGDAELFVAASILIHLAAVIPDLVMGAGSYYSFPKKIRSRQENNKFAA